MSKPWGRFRKFLWPSQKNWTLPFYLELSKYFKNVSTCCLPPEGNNWNPVSPPLQVWISIKSSRFSLIPSEKKIFSSILLILKARIHQNYNVNKIMICWWNEKIFHDSFHASSNYIHKFVDNFLQINIYF